jgi:hypothetical protein
MSLTLLAALPGGYFQEHMPWFEAIYRQRIELDTRGNTIVRIGNSASIQMQSSVSLSRFCDLTGSCLTTRVSDSTCDAAND